jgi:methylated-DNA-[protein]-cysteine S-methyltransferase
MTQSAFYPSPLGLIEIKATEESIKEALFVDGIAALSPPPNDLLKEAAEQLDAYFKGRIKAFNLPLEPEGTDFQQAAWLAMRHIPFGHKKTYGDIAEAAHSPGGARAVGQACNKNPLIIFVPCHRVVGISNPLDYGAGKDRKRWLLDHEGISFQH